MSYTYIQVKSSGAFEYEGGEMMFYVKWSADPEEKLVDIDVYADSTMRDPVTGYLFDDVYQKLVDLAWDEYSGGLV